MKWYCHLRKDRWLETPLEQTKSLLKFFTVTPLDFVDSDEIMQQQVNNI